MGGWASFTQSYKNIHSIHTLSEFRAILLYNFCQLIFINHRFHRFVQYNYHSAWSVPNLLTKEELFVLICINHSFPGKSIKAKEEGDYLANYKFVGSGQLINTLRWHEVIRTIFACFSGFFYSSESDNLSSHSALPR